MNLRIALSIIVGCGFAFAASAQTVTVTAETGETQTTTATSEADVKPQTPSRFCLQSTGSRVAAAANRRAELNGKKERRCAVAAGRVYTRDDIDHSGHVDLAEALRSLDPSIR
ncbi:MAG: hypothetical protein E6Q88_09410 [Lysobacteraceae bacterium]|nr:MAG: hypothetical protein E6Q88_09410 [Xanthomonadaceae bacterium]